MPTTREGQIKELFKFPRDRKVKYLYRYRSIESRELCEIFTDRKIYLASPATFNDPFDCRPSLTIYKSGPSRLSYLEKMAQETFPFADKNTLNQRIEEADRKLRSDPTYVERAYNDYIKKMGVYCLSKIPNDILMWSHYANGHKGICLEFDTTKDKRLFGQALNVDYSKTDEYPIVNIMDVDNPKEYHKALLTKSNHWTYEQEWRILKPIEEGGPGKHAFQAELLTGVILGALISPADKKEITDWVSNYPTKINIYRAKPNRTKYQLDIEAI
jgi:hypothetical protein